jgi:hypothetical protein
METAQQTAVFPPCGELINGQPCGKVSTAEWETVSGEKVFRCATHGVSIAENIEENARRFGRIPASSPDVRMTFGQVVSARFQESPIRTMVYFLAGVALLTGFVKWVWIHF